MNDECPHLTQCPTCESRRLRYAFSHKHHRIVRCSDCQLLFLNPQPSNNELAAIYTADYFLYSDEEDSRARVDETKRETARLYLAEIRRYFGAPGGRLLEVGCGDGNFLVEAEAAGFEVAGVEYSSAACENARSRIRGEIYCGEIENQSLREGQFDLCVLSDVIEHVRDPIRFMQAVHRFLKPGGGIFLTTCSLDSWSAKFLRQDWMEFKTEHLVYFDRRTLQTTLLKAGFNEMVVQPGWKWLSFDYVARHFESYQVPLVTPIIRLLGRILPQAMQRTTHKVVASGVMVFARKATVPGRKKLSVVMAAYNEAPTFMKMVDAVLQKKLADLEVELIIVESNSTDGTRELAEQYREHPRVKLILEDKPRGKGHAIRAGLQASTGDFILIQDADLEYDLEDYDALLEPLMTGREAFVLGSRHGGNVWKMRQFSGQAGLSALLNFGHWFFTTLVNVLFGQHLKDPFTMFKVFRRDCLFGLTFECNRFDFDFELLIKLIRKGYRPLELPVNYRSRTFQQGKKVSMVRDPLTWLRALVKLRFAKVDPLAEVERRRLLTEDGKARPAEPVVAAQKALCL